MGRKVLVGMLLLGALFIFGLGTIYIKNLQYYFQAIAGREGYQLRAQFQTAQSLNVGDEVRILGVEVGHVHDLKILEGVADKPVTALLWIEEGVSVRKQDTAFIEIQSIFGGSYVGIDRGDPQAPVLKNLDEIMGTEVRPTISDLVAKADTALGEASVAFADAGKAIENVRVVTDRLAEGKGLIRMLTDEEEYVKLDQTIQSAKSAFEGIDRLTKDVHEGEGLLPRLLSDGQLAQDVQDLAADARDAANSLKALVSDLEEGKGTLGKILKDEKLYTQITETFSEGREALSTLKDLAQEAKDGKGVLAKLLTDEKMAQDLEQITTDMRSFASELADLSENLDKGSLGKMLASDEAYTKFIEVLDELHASAQAIQEKKGTLGKLIYEDKVHTQLADALDSVQKLLDEYREQSPILTFAGAIFGAF